MIAVAPDPAVLAGLASTRPEPAGAAFLRTGGHARRLLLLKTLLVRVRRHRDAVAPAALRSFEAGWLLLERTERADPDVVRAALDYPTTGTWLAAALTEPPGPGLDRHLAYFELLAVTAALRAGLRMDLTVEAPDGVIPLPGLGRVVAGGPGRVRIDARSRSVRIGSVDGTGSRAVLRRHARGAVRAVTGSGPGWHGVRALPGGATRLEDLDPYRLPPGMGMPARAAADRADTDHAAWAGSWTAARGLLRATDRARSFEVGRTVDVVVPLVPLGTRSIGATLGAAPGAILMTPAVGALDMVETLVHEMHHSKLATLHELVPLHGPPPPDRAAPTYRVGWRRDLRPVAGVLQGAYAHLALADLWHRAARAPRGSGVPGRWRAQSARQFDHIHDQVVEALALLLESDELTNAGREFARQMGTHLASLGSGRRALGPHCAHGT
ncbi:HEXXH motif-containing protein [Streptomyces sp. PvR006]|uniref:aKG-HExxH-type peptide beta-hydroxylase n=1 Tax=Streptomyces sp. PvR006 TaxID=2817860 RepID=UPI001AE14D18|nr:HEXXH motif-containing putative peptide modification protein [Streptomyces sp. PvR006]MBP2584687.1 HEXXH motif-containing protein [Streptomyces sp. PvR006]